MPGFHPCIPCCLEYSQTSFCHYALLQISDLDELVFRPERYLFSRVPPQPNCQPIAVLCELVVSKRMSSVTLLLRRYQS